MLLEIFNLTYKAAKYIVNTFKSLFAKPHARITNSFTERKMNVVAPSSCPPAPKQNYRRLFIAVPLPTTQERENILHTVYPLKNGLFI